MHWRAVDREGANYARRVYAEDFRGTGDVSELLNPTAQAMTIGKMLIWDPRIYASLGSIPAVDEIGAAMGRTADW
jgi:hypothetical protein